jgi:hypothetical protein
MMRLPTAADPRGAPGDDGNIKGDEVPTAWIGIAEPARLNSNQECGTNFYLRRV